MSNTKCLNKIVYDKVLNKTGLLFKSAYFGKYAILYESHQVYFRVHPEKWCDDSDEDRGRYEIIGEL